jgi:hypothetical protein
MGVFVERRACTVQEGNRAEAGIRGRARAVLAQGGVQSAHEDAQDTAEQARVALEEVADALGDGQDPLAHGDPGDYVVNKVCCRFDHSPGIASNTSVIDFINASVTNPPRSCPSSRKARTQPILFALRNRPEAFASIAAAARAAAGTTPGVAGSAVAPAGADDAFEIDAPAGDQHNHPAPGCPGASPRYSHAGPL